MGYTYHLNKVRFSDGTEVEPGSLTVIVGPNNAGKSRTLKDIERLTTVKYKQAGPVVQSVDWSMPVSLEELREAYDVERYAVENGQWQSHILDPELVKEHTYGGPFEWPSGYEKFLKTGDALQHFVNFFGKAMVATLTTEHRLQLVKRSASPSHDRQSANLLQMLYNQGRTAEAEIRKVVKRAFGKEIALDFTSLQHLQIRVGDDFSSVPADPRDAKPLMAQHEKLDDQGDGIRSFVGMIVAILSVDRSVLLIDEPEAFLHPPQAFRIGEFIAEHATSGRQVLLATHSADVLRGLLSRTSDLTILRLARDRNINLVRRLEATPLKQLSTDPLLSSARVFDGLFYSGAVVVEADSDARFYHAASKKMRSDLDLHFVNADNKQTVPRIAKLYRQMGVPCAGIVDFDVLNEKLEFERQLNALGVSDEETTAALGDREVIAKGVRELPADQRLADAEAKLSELRNSIMGARQGTPETVEIDRLLKRIESKCREIADSTKPWKKVKEAGVAALPEEAQNAFNRIQTVCMKHGLFINPDGELESMLREYGIEPTTDKRAWILQALQLLPNLQVDATKNPWRFLTAIHDHLSPRSRQEVSVVGTLQSKGETGSAGLGG